MLLELVALVVVVSLHLTAFQVITERQKEQLVSELSDSEATMKAQVRASVEDATNQLYERVVFLLYGEMEEDDEWTPIGRLLQDGRQAYFSEIGKQGREARDQNEAKQDARELATVADIVEEVGPEVWAGIEAAFPEEAAKLKTLGPAAKPIARKLASVWESRGNGSPVATKGQF